MADLPEKITFEQKSWGGEGANHIDIIWLIIPGRGKGSVEALWQYQVNTVQPKGRLPQVKSLHMNIILS